MIILMPCAHAVWTIGHSTHPFERCVELLREQRIEFVIDVRSYPYSRHAPQFNREDLGPHLGEHGLHYLFLGTELGGRPRSEEHYDKDGHALYGRMSKEEPFKAAVARIIGGAAAHRLALLCSEGNPHECHRRLLVGKVLTDHGIELRHILPDGTVHPELAVHLRDDGEQFSFLNDAEITWRSTRSVSHRRRLSVSSGV
jgi:uncharacterized protein (DUF488 family)